MIFGDPRQDFLSVSSTQDIARDWAQRGAPPGAIVTAEAMTAGRGRLGRTWHVPPGANVCFTAIGPPVPLSAAWQIALIGGVAVCEALRFVLADYRDAARETFVRFPNDVFVAGRKVSGVLIETTVMVGAAKGFVVPLIGIGVNVRRPETPLPPEVANRAISLSEAANAEFDVAAVEQMVLERLTAVWQEWENDGFTATITRWKALTNTAMERVFIFENEPVPCRVIELTVEGEVTLETATGERRVVSAAQVILGD